MSEPKIFIGNNIPQLPITRHIKNFISVAGNW